MGRPRNEQPFEPLTQGMARYDYSGPLAGLELWF
jgi:hypothetical protein